MFAAPIAVFSSIWTVLTSVVPSLNVTVYFVAGIKVNLAVAVMFPVTTVSAVIFVSPSNQPSNV